MPEISGPDTYINLRLQKRDLPIIFITGYEAHAQVAEYKDADTDFITILQKPFTRESLGRQIREMLDR